jgi:tetratricopeptide (TPR) repeat protein
MSGKGSGAAQRRLGCAFAVLFAAVMVPDAAREAHAQTATSSANCDPPPARAVSVQGVVETRRGSDGAWQPVKLNDTFCPGDNIRVQANSRADIALLNQSVLRLNANSAIVVETPKERTTGVVNLLRGATHVLSRGPNSLEVQTPFTLAGVRGTEFYVSVEPEQTLLTVFEGRVVAENAAGNLTLTDGQSATAAAGRAPTYTIVARPRDAVQWTLYYPPVVYFRADEVPAGTDWAAKARTSSEAYRKGDLAGAFAAIQDVPADVADARFLSYRAHLLLSVGRVDEARRDLARALQLSPGDANAQSLQVIMAVVQDDKDQALALARKVSADNPSSAAAWIALSYAQQARFDLPGARASVEKALQLDSQNALAWARLAELQSSFGELSKALASAQKAVELEPGLARTQTVLGFAYLTQMRTAPAREALTKAITLDQADPLPRLGLGLAKIRDGQLDEGGRDIEVAASLDPSNALVRSYLGKTYFEEKRGPLDERELAMAKQLDPKDPTPYFYDAIAKQTTNRPVEALRDMEAAIALNDNRAVYRSALLLDADAAARAASLGRIYTDLGFQELALVEGWKSVNTDPTNFSAHRFLADSYSVLPRHQIARVSELLQSQLLQPINMTPLQPQLGESNLFLISAQGPGTASFNEFNPLFTRNGYTAQISGLAGEHDTWGADAVVAGIVGQASYSVGYSKFQTDGFRINNDQDDQIFNAFVQYDISPQASIQAEYRYRKTEIGDLQQKFFPENVLAGLRNTQELNTFRVGGRYSFTPDSILLASVMYQDARFGTVFDEPGIFTGLRVPQSSTSVELQHLLRTERFNLRSGIGFFDIDGEIHSHNVFDLPPPPDGPGLIDEETTTNTNIRHFNAYVYADWKLLPNVTVTTGASYDSLHGDLPGDSRTKNQFNPKLGVTWNPLPATTVRAAAFRALKRTLITNQTLEPTEVAGFNQFYDDGNLTKSWRYGAAIDQKFGRDVFGGVEVSKRNTTVPFLDSFSDPLNPPVWRTVDWDESLSRVYLFWTPHPWWALRAEYSLEKFDRGEEFTAGVKQLDIHRLPIGARFFHPSGVSAAVTATWWHEKGDFGFAPFLQSGSDRFWVVDAALNYRLPKRYGFISVGATNLFNQDFMSYDIDPANPSVQPRRTVFARVTLALP